MTSNLEICMLIRTCMELGTLSITNTYVTKTRQCKRQAPAVSSIFIYFIQNLGRALPCMCHVGCSNPSYRSKSVKQVVVAAPLPNAR